MNKMNMKSMMIVTLAVGIMLGNTGCFFSKSTVSSNIDGGAGSLAGINFDLLVSGVGMRDFKTVNSTYSVLTGVPTANTNIVNAYNGASSTLLGSMDIKQFNGPEEVAKIKLSSEYCNEAITANNTTLYPGLVLGTAVLANFSDAQRRDVATSLLRNLASEKVPASASVDVLVKLSYDLGQGLASSNANLKAVLVGMCTAVLASGKVSII